MSTLAPSPIKKFSDNTIEKKVYSFVDTFSNEIPIPNDRYRLSYNLIKYMQGEGDEPKILIKSAKIKYQNISEAELSQKLQKGIEDIKSSL